MQRWLSLALIIAVGTLGVTAQDKKDPPREVKKDPPKEKPKALPRIALNEPTEAAKNPDFAIQGEYESVGEGDKYGAQVVAQGNGVFYVRILIGGLPGAGWDGKTLTNASAKTQDGKVVLTDSGLTGTIGDGKLAFSGPKFPKALELKRVERKSKTLGAKAPEGAVVLFDKPEDVEKWIDAKVVELSDGKFLACTPGKNILSKQAFKNHKIHIEFRLAWMPNSRGQGRSNSGLYLQNRYECQMLDSFGLKGENNECGGFYTQHSPSVNMCLPPLVWQTYDIEVTSAEIGADGKVTKPARATVIHNGVMIHDNVALKGPTPGGKEENDKPGPLHLQWHGDPLVYRNIWVVETK